MAVNVESSRLSQDKSSQSWVKKESVEVMTSESESKDLKELISQSSACGSYNHQFLPCPDSPLRCGVRRPGESRNEVREKLLGRDMDHETFGEFSPDLSFVTYSTPNDYDSTGGPNLRLPTTERTMIKFGYLDKGRKEMVKY
ncbi:MAG: hypothetical protein M1834_008525 [Cirrosporium novae-zelandiae]|nr:MAG: hypothetical protein M1834_008525 [Cirrosporium novae-zelandiae]